MTPVSILSSAHRLLHDIARCLALASQGQLGLLADGCHLAPPGRQLVRLQTCEHPYLRILGVPDRAYAGFLLRLLGQAGMLAAIGSSLRPSTEADTWLGLPAHRQLRQLRQIWLLAPDIVWRSLPSRPDIHPRDGEWRALLLDTIALLAAQGEDDWKDLEGLSTELEASGAMAARGRGRNWAHVRHAVATRGRQLTGFLACQVLPGLGVVEVRGGVNPALRPTAEGLAWMHTVLAALRAESTPPAEQLPEIEMLRLSPHPPMGDAPALEVQLDTSFPGDPALLVTISPTAPALCVFEVAHIAALLSPALPETYSVTAQTFHRASGHGFAPTDVLFLLERYSDHRLPGDACSLISSWRDEATTIAYDTGFRLHLAEPALLAALRRRDPFRQRSLALATGQDAWVSAAQAHEVFRYLHRLGYTLQKTFTVENGSTALALPITSPLPLSQLLVVLRTYDRLRRLVPGLAVVDLSGLDSAITAALIPDDLAGVERLVESHRIFLRHHLKRDPGEEAEEEATEQAAEARAEGRPAAGREAAAAGAGTPALPGPQELEAALRDAIAAGRRLEITYADTQGHCTHRTVRPLHLEERWGRAYLLAYCELRRDERHFRLDRIVEARSA